jgi:hypothetical protein
MEGGAGLHQLQMSERAETSGARQSPARAGGPQLQGRRAASGREPAELSHAGWAPGGGALPRGAAPPRARLARRTACRGRGPPARPARAPAADPHRPAPPAPADPRSPAGLASSSGRTLDSHPMYPCAKLKLDQLFLQWLSLPDSQALVRRARGCRGKGAVAAWAVRARAVQRRAAARRRRGVTRARARATQRDGGARPTNPRHRTRRNPHRAHQRNLSACRSPTLLRTRRAGSPSRGRPAPTAAARRCRRRRRTRSSAAPPWCAGGACLGLVSWDLRLRLRLWRRQQGRECHAVRSRGRPALPAAALLSTPRLTPAAPAAPPAPRSRRCRPSSAARRGRRCRRRAARCRGTTSSGCVHGRHTPGAPGAAHGPALCLHAPGRCLEPPALNPPPSPPPSLSPPPQSPLASIPQFYYPGGAPPLSDDAKTTFAARVEALFGPHPGGLNLEQFSRVVQEVCGMPTILAHPWFERLVNGRPARLVERAVFVDWWASRGLVAAPVSKRLWEVLRPDGRNYLTYDDFKPLLQVRRGGGGGGGGGAGGRAWTFGGAGAGGRPAVKSAATAAGAAARAPGLDQRPTPDPAHLPPPPPKKGRAAVPPRPRVPRRHARVPGALRRDGHLPHLLHHQPRRRRAHDVPRAAAE